MMEIYDVDETTIQNRKFTILSKIMVVVIIAIILLIIHLVMDIFNRGYLNTPPLDTELWIHEVNFTDQKNFEH